MEPSTNELMWESGVRTICEMFGPSIQTKCENSYSKVPPKSGFSRTLISWNIPLKVSSSHSVALSMERWGILYWDTLDQLNQEAIHWCVRALSLTWSAAAVALTMSVKSWGLRALQRSAYQIISKPATAIMTLWGVIERQWSFLWEAAHAKWSLTFQYLQGLNISLVCWNLLLL